MIAWEARGPSDAPAVVLVHSLGLDRRMWEPQVVALEKDHRVVLVDLRGHGQSAAPLGPYSLEALAGDVLEACDAAGLDRFHLCGLSLGGSVALWLAIFRPERLFSAVYANTAARVGTTALWEARIAAVEAGGMEAVRDTVRGRLFTSGFAARAPLVVEAVASALLATSATGYAGCCAALRDADLRAHVGVIAVPSLVVGSPGDEATPLEAGRWLHRRIAGSELAIIEGAGHLSNLEQPEAFTAALRAFWSRAGG